MHRQPVRSADAQTTAIEYHDTAGWIRRKNSVSISLGIASVVTIVFMTRVAVRTHDPATALRPFAAESVLMYPDGRWLRLPEKQSFLGLELRTNTFDL
jgi:hypothetical protein